MDRGFFCSADGSWKAPKRPELCIGCCRELDEDGVCRGVEPAKEYLHVFLRHGRASRRPCLRSFPDVHKNTGPSSGNDRAGVMIDNDAPSVLFVPTAHLLIAFPVRLDQACIDNPVIMRGLDVIDTPQGRSRFAVRQSNPGIFARGSIPEGAAQSENARRGPPISFPFIRTAPSMGIHIRSRMEANSPAQAIPTNHNGDCPAHGSPYIILWERSFVEMKAPLMSRPVIGVDHHRLPGRRR